MPLLRERRETAGGVVLGSGDEMDGIGGGIRKGGAGVVADGNTAVSLADEEAGSESVWL